MLSTNIYFVHLEALEAILCIIYNVLNICPCVLVNSGWYATRTELAPYMIQTHQQMNRLSNRPFLLLLDPDVNSDATELPMNVYELSGKRRIIMPENLPIYIHSYITNKHESITLSLCLSLCVYVCLYVILSLRVHLAESGTDAFVKVPFKVESDDAERVTLDYCAKVVQEVEEGNVSQVATPFVHTNKALDSLEARVKVIVQYLSDVKSGEKTPNQQLLREIRGLCNRLPATNSESFREDYMQVIIPIIILITQVIL